MNFRKTARASLVLLAISASGLAGAASIVSDTAAISGPTEVIDFNSFDGLTTAGPLDVGGAPGAVVFTSNPFTTVGANAQDLGLNGLWGARVGPTPTGDGNFVASAFVARRGELSFNFAAPTTAVGAFFNQYQFAGVTNSLRLSVFDAQGNDIESFTYTVDTDEFGYNEGKFLGFSRASADIYGFAISDGTFVMDNLTISAVPEPESYALFAAGLGMLMMMTRRRVGR